MIVRILEARHLGRTAVDQAKRFLSMQDVKHQVSGCFNSSQPIGKFTSGCRAILLFHHVTFFFQVQFVEIVKRPGQTLGLYIREGNGQDRQDGVFISRIALESAVYNSGCLKVNAIDYSQSSVASVWYFNLVSDTDRNSYKSINEIKHLLNPEWSKST